MNDSSKRSVTLRFLRIAAALLVVVAFAPSALAAKPRVGLALTGSKARAVHDAMSAALSQHGFETVDVDADIDDDGQDAAVAAKRERLMAVFVGEVRASGRCTVKIYSASGDVVGDASWAERSASKLAPTVGRTLWARVGDVLTKTAAGAAPAGHGAQAADKADDASAASADAPAKKKAAASSEGDEEEAARRKHVAIETTAEEPGPSGSAGTALDLAVGMRLFSRNLSFSPGGTALRNFSVSGRSALGIAGAWYPAASYRADWLANLGIGASVEWLPGLDSVTSGGASYPTTAADLRADIRYRLLLSNGGQIAFAVGGGQQSFVFRSDGTAQRIDINYLPDVQYSYMRAGVDARFVLPASISLLLAGGYRYVPSAGSQDYLIQQSSYLPGSSVMAFDVGAGAGYRFTSAVEARAGFDLRRYQLSGGTAGTATSATDQYTAFWLQVAVLLDGIGTTEDHATAKPRHADESE